MTARLLHELLTNAARTHPERIAVRHDDRTLTYREIEKQTATLASNLAAHGLTRGERIAVFLPKCVEVVQTTFASSMAGAIFVPINPVLKPAQVAHILQDSGARILVTAAARLELLEPLLGDCKQLKEIAVIDGGPHPGAVSWANLTSASGHAQKRPSSIDTDPVAILYTSGSTGRPKGVVLSHRNMVAGAQSVAEYLGNTPDDRILALLPLSFDAGFSQITTAFAVGARVVLLDYLLARDVVRVAVREGVTGITGVPPLWSQLTEQKWPAPDELAIRYFANTGGKMPRTTLQRLRTLFPRAQPFLMYGLTEAFRSTYLDPSQVDARPDSIGKAIPNVEVLVVRPDGTLCEPNEPGELVHRGPLVSLGYWNDPARTAERFRPAPAGLQSLPLTEMAVWSGDTVRKDEEGFIYFVGRRDEMIKTSGYRVSPTEVEEVAFASGLVAEAAAFGIPDERLGQTIVLIAHSKDGGEPTAELLSYFTQTLPQYMAPKVVMWRAQLPRNANGKIDRALLANELRDSPPGKPSA